MGAMPATTERSWLPPGRPLTVDDLEGAPNDGHRYELLDGALIVSPAPGRWHQKVVVQLLILLDHAAPDDGEVLGAPFAVHPDDQRATELQPDVLVAPAADFTDRDLPGPPLLAVEVLSPSTRLVDLALKKAAYERMGTASYWVLDPTVPDLRVWELDDAGGYQLVAHVRGEEEFEASRPFPVTVRPAALLRRSR
jgi:Uma2 family endonuclease